MEYNAGSDEFGGIRFTTPAVEGLQDRRQARGDRPALRSGRERIRPDVRHPQGQGRGRVADHRRAANRSSSRAQTFMIQRVLVAILVLTTVGVMAQTPPPAAQLHAPLPPPSALRPAVMGPTGGVSTGHPLTTAAAFEILLKGGNAFDAGVAAMLAGGVVEQDLYSLGGEALVLVYPKKEKQGHRRSSARAGRRRRSTSTGTCRARRRWTATGSIRPSCPARCTPR